MTGKRVDAVKAYGNNNLGVPTETRGLGAVLGEQDVHTVFVGKVHAYRPVEELGFAETIETSDGPSAFYEAQNRRPLAVCPGALRASTSTVPVTRRGETTSRTWMRLSTGFRHALPEWIVRGSSTSTW